MRGLGRIAVPVALAAAALASQAAAATPSTYTAFQTPSKLIGCFYSSGLGPTVLRCDTVYHTRWYARRRCAGEYGDAVGMSPRGAARALCVSDTALDPSAPVLAYGVTRRFGPYTCTSRPSGLRCTNAAGHGWLLSRQRQALF